MTEPKHGMDKWVTVMEESPEFPLPMPRFSHILCKCGKEFHGYEGDPFNVRELVAGANYAHHLPNSEV